MRSAGRLARLRPARRMRGLAERGRRWLLRLAGPVSAGRRPMGHRPAGSAGRVDDWYRRRQRWPPGRTLVAADLEGQRRAVRIADVDPQAVLDVDDWHATVVDEQSVEAAIVDGDPSALVESHEEVCSGDQWVCNADVRAKVTPDDYVVACREGAFGSLVPHGQHRRGWSAHQVQLYRHRRHPGCQIVDPKQHPQPVAPTLYVASCRGSHRGAQRRVERRPVSDG